MNDSKPKTGPVLDTPLYERLISDGIADADKRGGPVDHVTARRLAIWLAARPQQRDFAESLEQFTRTGAISQQLAMQVRTRARSADYPHRAQAVRLLQYCASRRSQAGPLGPDFGAACDQMDQADAMLIDARDRARNGSHRPRQPGPAAGTPTVTARANRDPANPTVTFTMDATTANIAIYAIAAHAGEREAYAREVEQYGRGLPEDSYGYQNRQAIATRESRAAARLRAIERAYQIAMGHAAER